nr:hypothetical protein [Tanacetum cinerariifolium]
MQTQTSNAFHNAIMEAGGKDRPPMLAPEWQRFVTLVRQSQELKTVSYHKLYDILKLHQNKVNEIRPERLARTANPLALDKEIDKLMALISLSFKKTYKPTNNNLQTSSNTSRANHDNSPRINRGTRYDNQMIVNVAGARENVDQELEAHYMYMAQIQEVTPYVANNFGPIFDTEPLQKVPNNDNYNVFAIESKHPKQSKSINDTYPVKHDAHNVIIDSLDMRYDRQQVDQDDDDDDLANERDLLAFLIEKLKCEIDDSKNRMYTELDEVTNLQCDYLETLDKCECLEKELSKSKIMSNSFEALQKHAINLELELHQFTAQILPLNNKSILKNINMIAPGMYKLHTKPIQTRTTQLPYDIRKTNKRVSFSTRVIPYTSVSRPQLKSNQIEDRVILNNRQGKKQEVEDHRRNVKLSNNKTSETACNDSLNAKTSNVNFVCVTCGKCVLNDNHDKCVLHYLNGMNSRTKMPMAVPLSTRETKRIVNQSVATPLKRTVASESTNQKPKHTTRKLYESLIEIILFIVDSGCSKNMMGNLKLLTNFVEKFLGSVKFRNDQIAPILGYRDLVQGTVTIKRVYYVEGLNHNLFFVGQFCDTDLEVAFRKSMCYIRDLNGNNLLTGSHGTDLYSITLQDTSSPNLICLMAKVTSSQAWDHHQTSVARTPEQNGIVERRNRTLVEAARTMLSTAKVPLFFWAEAIAASCFTQNRSLVIPRHEKTPYHIINNQKPSVFFYIFGSLCYIVRDGENLDKIKEKGHVSSDPVPQCPITTLEHDSLSPDPPTQENVPQC